jgi:hypothetical protein
MPPTVRSNGTTRQAIPPLAPLPPPTPQTLATEYVSGGGYPWYSKLARALPPTIDDITSDFGDDIYERMAIDPTIAKCLSIFKASILEDGADLNPAIKDDQDPDYELAVRIRDEADAMLNDLETALDDVLWNMADHLAFGNVVAEQRYALQRGHVETRELLQLVALKPKPRRTYAFVVDAYMNVLGLLGQMPGQSNPYMGQVALDPEQTPNILPREKFAIATFRPRNSDPRGTSILRPAYDPWWRKRQMLPEWLKFLAQFASPSIWGTTPENAQTQPPLDSLANPVVDADGNLLPPYTPSSDPPLATDPLGQNPRPSATWTMTPEQRLASAIMELRNGTALAVPFGTVLHVLEMQGKGEAFTFAKADCDRDIVGAILTQSLATEEGQHQARAAAEVHQDVLDTIISQSKRGMIRMIRRDILRPWVIYNWGAKAVHLVPLVSLGKTEPQDLASLITALASAGYALHESQLSEIDELVNLPVRDLTQDDVTPPTEPDPSIPPPPKPAQKPPAKMSDRVEPKVGHRPGKPEGAYSAADRRLLVELFDDAFPEAAGLLDAKVRGAQ